MANYIPDIGPLHTIKDQAAQSALSNLADGWRARNGNDKNIRFITEAEVEAMIKAKTPTAQSITYQVTQEFTRQAEAATSTAPAATIYDLLPLDNRWTGINTWDEDTPATEQAPNAHMVFDRDKLARIVFRLGHRPIPTSINGGLGLDTTGNFYVCDPGRPGEAGDVFFTLNAFPRGGALSFLDRTLTNAVNKTAIQLRETMKIGWESSGVINTYFSPQNGRWTLENNGFDRFGINVNTASPYAIFVDGHALSAGSIQVLRDGSPANLQQQCDSYIASFIDLGQSVNNIRNLAGSNALIDTINAHSDQLSRLGGPFVEDLNQRFSNLEFTVGQHGQQLASLGGAFTDDLNTRFTNIEARLAAGGL